MSMEKLQEELTKLTDKNILESSNDILASTYVQMYAIVDDLKKSMDFLKKEILKREYRDWETEDFLLLPLVHLF